MNLRIDKKKPILLALVVLLSICFLLPMAIGYGTSFYNAEEITNGSYNYSISGSDDAYYKVYCRSGDYLAVSLSMQSGADLDLVIFDENYYTEDSSYTSGSNTEYCSVDVYSTGWYVIEVSRWTPSSGTVTFTLVISGASGQPGIPGFGIILVLIGLGVLGLLLNRTRIFRKNSFF